MIDIIYSYEDCSKESFRVILNNFYLIYDLTSPYWRLKKIIDEEINTTTRLEFKFNRKNNV